MELESLVKISRKYWRIMNWEVCEEQSESLTETVSTAESNHYLSQSDLLYKLELILHLVEILYLNSTPRAKILPHLLHWTSLHFTGCEDRARSILSQDSEEPSSLQIRSCTKFREILRKLPVFSHFLT